MAEGRCQPRGLPMMSSTSGSTSADAFPGWPTMKAGGGRWQKVPKPPGPHPKRTLILIQQAAGLDPGKLKTKPNPARSVFLSQTVEAKIQKTQFLATFVPLSKKFWRFAPKKNFGSVRMPLERALGCIFRQTPHPGRKGWLFGKNCSQRKRVKLKLPFWLLAWTAANMVGIREECVWLLLQISAREKQREGVIWPVAALRIRNGEEGGHVRHRAVEGRGLQEVQQRGAERRLPKARLLERLVAVQVRHRRAEGRQHPNGLPPLPHRYDAAGAAARPARLRGGGGSGSGELGGPLGMVSVRLPGHRHLWSVAAQG